MAMTPETEPRVRPAFLVLGAVALVAVIGLVIINLTGRDPAPEPTPPPVALPQPTPVEPTPAPEEPIEDMDVFEIFEGRDPFRPLVFAPAAPPPDAPPPDGVAPTPAPAPGVTPAPTPIPPREGVQVEVLSVAEDSSSATVRVGSQVHTDAREGQTLSAGVTVVSIQGRCVNFRRDGQNFRLCEGERIHK